MARIFITGGTGFVGRKVVNTALNHGHTVTALVRSPEKAKKAFGEVEALEYVKGDIFDDDAMRKGMEDCDAVIHLVGIIMEQQRKGITFDKIHYRGAANVMDSAKDAKVPRFIHMSALGTKPGAKSTYHKTKLAAEKYLKTSGLDYTIFRPSVIFGDGDGFVSTFADLIRTFPVVPVIGGGENKFQPIWVGDVAECFVQAVEKEETAGKEYGLAGVEEFSLNEVIDEIMKAMGKHRLKVRLPLFLAKLNASFLEKILNAPPLTRDQLIMLQDDNICSEDLLCDPEAMLRDFDLEMKPFQDGIREYL